LLSAQQQGMQMVSLRNRFMDSGFAHDVIALKDKDLIEMISQYPSRHEPSYAAADYHRILTGVFWHKIYPWIQRQSDLQVAARRCGKRREDPFRFMRIPGRPTNWQAATVGSRNLWLARCFVI
jgi:hypothetical protein